jgi:hypothetical protein
MDNFNGYRFVFCIKKQNKSNGVFQEGERWKWMSDKKFHVEILEW